MMSYSLIFLKHFIFYVILNHWKYNNFKSYFTEEYEIKNVTIKV